MTALEVAICRCSHAERMHEKDTTAEHDRGVCFKNGCGCTEYRPGSGTVEQPDETPVEAAAAEPVQAADLTAPRLKWTCEDCGQAFDRPQGLGSHRRYVHTKTGTAAAAPTAAVPTHVEEEPAPATPDDEEDDDRACLNCGDTVISLSPRGWCDGCEEEAEAASTAALDFTPPARGRHSMFAHIKFGNTGYVELRLDDATDHELADFAGIVARFVNASPYTNREVRP